MTHNVHPMTMYYHTQKNKKLDDVKKFLLERYDFIEFIIEYENDIIKINKIHRKNYEALIIVDTNDIVKSCSVKYLDKLKNKKNNCNIL
jgi:hypothetical protein